MFRKTRKDRWSAVKSILDESDVSTLVDTKAEDIHIPHPHNAKKPKLLLQEIQNISSADFLDKLENIDY